MSAPPPTTTPPAPLTFDEIDDLIYSARLGDVDALRTDISALSQKYSCSTADILCSAIDMEDESEGGTGACLLHWPAANGNVETLNYLLSLLPSPSTTTTTSITNTNTNTNTILNHRNHSGNTPLHWAALNTHLDCVQALVGAGADITAKNDAGHDAVFLAERTEWTAVGGDGDEEEKEGEEEADGVQEVEVNVDVNGDGEGEGQREVSKGMQVVEWLLGCEKGAGFERGAGVNGEGSGSGSAAVGEGMEGVEGN
ncbi:hypothetical protein FQN55_006516 [Onygenales sp. PD_40]|nr:hypothetical protein FQN55_006516 [Onygenales sp. PD_40]